VALGIGLLIGVERERRKGEGPTRSPAGIRTFAAASLVGAISFVAGGQVLFAISIAGVILLAAIAYSRGHEADPGLTTEIALIGTTLLGGLSMQTPMLAAGLGVVIAILLAARTPLHRFARSVLTEDELKDGLILAGATLVVLPLLPNRQMGPFGALNPQSIWMLVILVMVIGAVGHVAVRTLGVRHGLPLSGLAAGFISSTATIAAMGARSTKTPSLLASTVSAAVLSNLATVVQLALVIAATSMTTLTTLSASLICAGIAAMFYGIVFTVRAIRQNVEGDAPGGHPFSLATAFVFAGTLAFVLIASAALREWFGETGAIVAATLAGFVDTHSAAISISSLVASEKMNATEAALPILAGLSANTISKGIVAATTGTHAFALRVIAGLIIVALAAWAGAPNIFFESH
jgi:uncharacterized membrane protein (DUF4010 family)